MGIKAYGIGLTKETSGNPEFYYNSVRDVFVRGFQGGCMFYSKEEAREKTNELELFGTEIVEGYVK